MTIMALRHPASGPLAVLAVCLVAVASVSAQSSKAETKTETKIDTSKYVIFIHAGGGPKQKDDRTVRLISGALYGNGYIVRAPDDDQDELGGPGVDYFDDTAKDAAQNVAAIVNGTFVKLDIKREPKQMLNPRKTTNTKNPPNWLGVWLF